MTTPTTFLDRMQPVIDALPQGPDKEKLLALVESQDTIERSDVHPRERARAMRRILRIDMLLSSERRAPDSAQIDAQNIGRSRVP